jgi:hypothetical protein
VKGIFKARNFAVLWMHRSPIPSVVEEFSINPNYSRRLLGGKLPLELLNDDSFFNL